jgi:hypothetical protein
MSTEDTRSARRWEEPKWNIQRISDNSALVRYDQDTLYVIGATQDSFVLKVLKGGDLIEEASLCRSQSDPSVSVIVNAGNKTSRLHLKFDGGCVSLRYFLDNELVFEEVGSASSGYSAMARKYAADTEVYDRSSYLKQFIQKTREDSFFKQQVARSILQVVSPAADPVDFCDWACKACWNWMYLPHSCIACIYCNGFTVASGPDW